MVQLSFLDTGPSQADPAFARVRRIELSPGAWLELTPGWHSGPTALFDRLRAAAAWEAQSRTMYQRTVRVPRLLAPCPGATWDTTPSPDQRRSRSLDAQGTPAAQAVSRELRALSSLLGRRYGRLLESITLAYYRDGRDSVAFHGDKVGALRSDTVVAILSLGARRKFVLRPSPEGGEPGAARRAMQVGEGDLLVMGGDCQRTWQHAVPKVRCAGPRIAVMFRERVPEANANSDSGERVA